MNDHNEIQNIMASYGTYADAGEFDAWSKMFAADGVLRLGEQVMATGPAALRDMFEKRPKSNGSHLIFNISTDVAGEQAEGKASFLFVNSDKAIHTVGVYLARFYKDDRRWKITSWQILL